MKHTSLEKGSGAIIVAIIIIILILIAGLYFLSKGNETMTATPETPSAENTQTPAEQSEASDDVNSINADLNASMSASSNSSDSSAVDNSF